VSGDGRGRVTIGDVAILLWIVAGIALAIAEMFTASFVLIMFAAGAFAAALSAALGAPLAAQGLVFAVVSVLALVAVRPALRGRLAQADDAVTSVGEITGSEGVVLERVDADHGVIKIDGEVWRARALDHLQVMEPGERVRVVEIKGVTAMVWRD
jgi:membrane protein implicated in regulation of membrane protease activity